MTNPTTPFSWQMPTASDLVTDLPADFETFGQAVATSMADLLGGTTGQVLSKASNTDMDFIWVTSDDANAIQNAIVDAKGDLIAASAADTPARLAVGNNGETLVADSSTSTGLRWTGTTSASNPFLNASHEVAQRGTAAIASNAATNQFVTDRWNVYRAVAGGTFSRQNTNDSTNLPNIRYCARIARDSGNTATNALVFTQNIETVNSIPFAGKTVTMSFYARAGANYSPTSSALLIQLVQGFGTDQNVLSGFTSSSAIINSSATLTTTWQRFTFTGTVSSTATQLAPYIYSVPVGTAGAADFFEITGVQLDSGSVALPYRTYAATLQGELAACQRYYWQPDQFTTSACYVRTSTTGYCSINMLVPMRTSPSASYTAADLRLSSLSTDYTGSSVSGLLSSKESVLIQLTVSGGGMTAGAGGIFFPVNNSAIRLSAEL